MLEASVGIVERVDAVAPALIAEGRIGDDIVKGLEGVAFFEQGIGQRVALQDKRSRGIVQDHVHPGQAGGGGVLFLSVEGGLRDGLIAHLQK